MQRFWLRLLHVPLVLMLWVGFTHALSSSDALRVVQPVTSAGSYAHTPASFGPQHFTTSGAVIVAQPRLGCSTLDTQAMLYEHPETWNFTGNASAASESGSDGQSGISGTQALVILIERGNCSFQQKVEMVEAMVLPQGTELAGIVINNVANSLLTMVALDPRFRTEFPTMSVTLSARHRLDSAAQVAAGLAAAGGDGRVLVELVTRDATLPPEVASVSYGSVMVTLIIVTCCLCSVRLCVRTRQHRQFIRSENERIRMLDNLQVQRFAQMHAEEEEERARRLSRLEEASATGSSHQLLSSPHMPNSCSICLEDFAPADMVKVLPCGHPFHPQCIDPWITNRSELCPLCKQSIFTATNHFGSSSHDNLSLSTVVPEPADHSTVFSNSENSVALDVYSGEDRAEDSQGADDDGGDREESTMEVSAPRLE